MVFDDYGYMQFPGAKKAVDKYLREFDDPFLFYYLQVKHFQLKGRVNEYMKLNLRNGGILI